MKILHINTSKAGGAAWCAIRISKALKVEGVESKMLFAEGGSMPDGVEGGIAEPDRHWWMSVPVLRSVVYRLLPHIPYFLNQRKLQRMLDKANDSHLYLHQPLSDYTSIAHHPLVEWADIIHLHWVSDFVDYPTFFRQVKKPIVWTLHDKYPAVGVQHYCSGFYQVPEKLKPIDALCKRIKREGVLKSHQLYLVAISEQMVDVCRNSEVLRGYAVTLIHNGVDKNVFKPYDKLEARKELALLSDATIFLFSSYGIHDKNKGLDRVITALEELEIPNKVLLCIGGIYATMPDATFPIILMGMLGNQSKIAKCYSAADFFLQSSYEETFAQTPLEAMACGIPVISTPCSGATDLIRPFNGVVCDGFDSESISVGIKKALSMKYDPVAIRQHILDNYQYDIIAKEYIKLYKSLLSD